MSLNDTTKILKRSMARYGLFASDWFFAHLPYGVVRFFARAMVAVAFQFIVKQRRIAEESLHIAFGEEKSGEEIDRIIRQCFKNFGYGMVEMIYFMSHPKLADENVCFEGRHHLDGALKKGKGVIAVTAHFGNFPLMMFYCARQGYKVSSIIRPTRDQNVEEFLLRKRRESGLNTVYAIPRRECVAQSLKVLGDNGVLFIPLDQNFGSHGGVYVDFFGQKAATATGPVVFAQRTGAAILPMFIIRQDDGRHKVVIEPSVDVEKRDNEEETNFVNISKITRLIEQYIRRYPQEWGWMHRRWKSRPAGEPAVGTSS